MIGLIEGIRFSRYTRFDVYVVDDYHVEATFDPQAPSDNDYYGFRDTDFYVTRAFGTDAVGEYEFTQEEIESFVDINKDSIMLEVQDAIDDMEKDNAI